jgi:hypothetical protein
MMKMRWNCLWTAATIGPIVHPPYEHGEPWWSVMGKLLIRPLELCQTYQPSYHYKAGGIGKGNDEFCLMKYCFHTSKSSLTYHKILWNGADGFTFPSKEGLLLIIPLKNSLTSARFEHANLVCKASTLTTRPPRMALRWYLEVRVQRKDVRVSTFHRRREQVWKIHKQNDKGNFNGDWTGIYLWFGDYGNLNVAWISVAAETQRSGWNHRATKWCIHTCFLHYRSSNSSMYQESIHVNLLRAVISYLKMLSRRLQKVLHYVNTVTCCEVSLATWHQCCITQQCKWMA